MKQLETDVVVVAAGLSGLAASVAAAEGGARVITLEKASNTGGAANMGMGPAAAGSPVQKGSMIEVTPGELFRRHMFYTHYQVDARLVRDYYFKSGDTIAWLQDMGVVFNSVRPAFRARERTRGYSDGEYTWHVVQPEDGSEPGPRAATTMTKRMTERAQELGVEFMLECPATGLVKGEDGAWRIQKLRMAYRQGQGRRGVRDLLQVRHRRHRRLWPQRQAHQGEARLRVG